MEKNYISVEGIRFAMNSGVPFSYDGIFTQKRLPAIKLSLSVYGSEKEEEVENLLKKERVIVEDPFIGQTYEASIVMRQNSFQVGKEGKSYVLELKQVDTLPPIETIELDGITFQVLQYYEELQTSDKIGRHGLLKLSEEELEQFRKLLGKSSVKFRRIEIDNVPLELRFGSAMYWSQHTDNDKEYFKQIVRLFPLDLEPSKLNMASAVAQDAMANMLISLHARFELLVKELATNKAISEETQSALLGSGWRDLLPKEKISELYDELDQVDDAEKEL